MYDSGKKYIYKDKRIQACYFCEGGNDKASRLSFTILLFYAGIIVPLLNC